MLATALVRVEGGGIAIKSLDEVTDVGVVWLS
jgi:hypothetical protein